MLTPISRSLYHQGRRALKGKRPPLRYGHSLRQMNRAFIHEITALHSEKTASARQHQHVQEECHACAFNHECDLRALRTVIKDLQGLPVPSIGQDATLVPLRSLSLENLESPVKAMDAADKAVRAAYEGLTVDQKRSLAMWFRGGYLTMLELNDRDSIYQMRKSLADEAAHPPRQRKSDLNIEESLEDLLRM